MSDHSMRRKVLVVAEERAIKNLLSLVKKLDSRRVVRGNWALDLSAINRSSFDTAILDMRCSEGRPAGRGFGLGELNPSMVGRTLVINAEVNDRKTLQAVERYIFHRNSLGGMLFDLATFARTLVGRSPWPDEI